MTNDQRAAVQLEQALRDGANVSEGEGVKMKVVINKCSGGFGLSEAAYEKLIEWGVPVRKYIQQEFDEETRRFKPQPLNDGEVIFDRELTGPEEDPLSAVYHKFKPHAFGGRYWDTWTSTNRAHPLVIRVIEELGEAANGKCAKLAIVEIPDGIEYNIIEEYDGGPEYVAEVHQTWG